MKTLAFMLILALAAVQATPAATTAIIEQNVAKVNTETISKLEVEERMGVIVEKLADFRNNNAARGIKDDAAEAECTRLYVEAFRDALRPMVRERLMLQEFDREKMSLDEAAFQKRLNGYLKSLRERKISFDLTRETKRIREVRTIEEFRGKFDNQLEFPKRFEVERYYREHLESYQRKAAAKIRIIRINFVVEGHESGSKQVRENPYELIQAIQKEIKEGVPFSEAARLRNDERELRERHGLLRGAGGDAFIVPDEHDKIIAAATRDLKAGQMTAKPFEHGKAYAIAFVEARREAGPAPLDDALYGKLYNELYNSKRVRKEDEWFRATLARSIVLQVADGSERPLPLEFFFPDDLRKPDFISSPQTDKKEGLELPRTERSKP